MTEDENNFKFNVDEIEFKMEEGSLHVDGEYVPVVDFPAVYVLVRAYWSLSNNWKLNPTI